MNQLTFPPNTDHVVADYNEYIRLIQAKDAAKAFADKKNKERSAAWREYYRIDELVQKKAGDLGLGNEGTFVLPATPEKKDQGTSMVVPKRPSKTKHVERALKKLRF